MMVSNAQPAIPLPTACGDVVCGRGLRMQFGHHRVLDDVSVEIREGQVTAIVGGSGSGKSTLMRILAMLQEPTRGEVELFGRRLPLSNADDELALRKRMGVMFQQGALFGNLSVLDNICLPLREHTRLSESLVRELGMLKLRLAGLEDSAAAKLPSELSGGMRKRTAVARGISLDPDVLFLDEPSSGLDPVSADAMDDLVLELKAALPLTIILVTHDMNSVWRVADRVLLLADSNIAGDGALPDLLESTDQRVQAFFRSRRGRAAESLQ